MKFLLNDWQTNRYDLTLKPVGYPESEEGKAIREAIREANANVGAMEELHKSALRQIGISFWEKNMKREATDVAKTPPHIFERINEYLGLTKASYFDITVYKPHYEKRKDFDAMIQKYPSDLAYNNFPWGDAEGYMEIMAEKFLK